MILQVTDATLEHLERRVQELCAARWRNVASAAGDPIPMVAMYRRTAGALHVHDAEPSWFRDRNVKAALVDRIAFGALASAADFVAISNTMLALADPDEMEEYGRGGLAVLRGHESLTALWENMPGLVSETAMVWTMTARGAVGFQAIVVRDDERPPVLGPWDRHEGMEGPMVDPIVRALVEVAGAD